MLTSDVLFLGYSTIIRSKNAQKLPIRSGNVGKYANVSNLHSDLSGFSNTSERLAFSD